MKSSRYSETSRAADILGRLKKTSAGKPEALLEKLKGNRPKAADSENRKSEEQTVDPTNSSSIPVEAEAAYSIPYSLPQTELTEADINLDEAAPKAAPPQTATPELMPEPPPQTEIEAPNRSKGEDIYAAPKVFTPPTLPETLTGREDRLKTLLFDMVAKGAFDEAALLDSEGLSLVGSSDSSSRGKLAAVTVLTIEAVRDSIKYLSAEAPLSLSVKIAPNRFLSIRGFHVEGEVYYFSAISDANTLFENFEGYFEAFAGVILGSRAKR